MTGGNFVFKSDFDIKANDQYVIDFKNSSTLARFKHTILDTNGQLIATMQGGIEREEKNPFFLRHGREVQLSAGHYQLVTQIASPFFIAIPQPYLDTKENYTQAIKTTNALTLVCLGIFIGLGIYYAALASVRRHLAEAMYALFILGNLVFNSTSLLVFSDLLGVHQFYLSSVPILFSNMAYIVFVISLLEINHYKNPYLYKIGIAILCVMIVFIGLAMLHPNWSMELARYGVGCFLSYGVVSGIVRSLQGNRSARLYLIAILTFFMLGSVAISSAGFVGEYTFYIEHLGLGSVAVEVILLALVLSYQFAQLHKEKELALSSLKQSQVIAMTDALTGLPNRYALEIELDKLPHKGSLTFLDLDGLKYYNDHFGHEQGDKLLRDFGELLQKNLGGNGKLHRLGGDEFAITSSNGDLDLINHMIKLTVEELSNIEYKFAGASAGSVYVHESHEKNKLMHLADTRMYENKRQRKEKNPEIQQ